MISPCLIINVDIRENLSRLIPRDTVVDTRRQLCAYSADLDLQGSDRDTQPLSQAFTAIDLRSFFVAIVFQDHLPRIGGQLFEAGFEACVFTALVFGFRGEVNKCRLAFALLGSQPFEVDLAPHAVEISGRLTNVVRSDGGNLRDHAIDGPIGQKLRLVTAASDEHPDQPLADLFVLFPSRLVICVEPTEQQTKTVWSNGSVRGHTGDSSRITLSFSQCRDITRIR